EYIDEQGYCHTCDASCAKCWGPTQEDCTSCPITRHMYQSMCILQRRMFTKCMPSLDYKHGQEHFLYEGECRKSCPVGHYPAKGHACLPCPDNCELCHNPDVCTRCTSGYFIVPTNHTCQKLDCQQGEFQDSEYEECIPCEEGCLGCTVEVSSVDIFHKGKSECLELYFDCLGMIRESVPRVPKDIT
ncbi:hypothetical protein STEG23_023159, partial [Scotinomys teguina]